MDIKEYRYVYEIARQGNISKAAKVLYISQPSLSAYLKNLENRLDTKLFVSVDGKMQPTGAGEIYLEHAQQILGIDGAMMEMLEGIKRKRTGRVRIGISSARSPYLIPGLLKLSAERYPGIELRFTEAISKELEELAYRREVDFILTNRPFRTHELEYQVLLEEETVIAIPGSAAMQIQSEKRSGFRYPWIDIRQLSDMPFTLLKSGHRLRQIAENTFLTMEKTPRVLFETQSAQTAVSMANSGLCACFIYDTYCKINAISNVELFSFGETPIPHQLVIARAPKSILSEPAAAISELAIEYAQHFKEQML